MNSLTVLINNQPAETLNQENRFYVTFPEPQQAEDRPQVEQPVEMIPEKLVVTSAVSRSSEPSDHEPAAPTIEV